MKLTIIGAGAIGGTIGAHMIRAGHEIVFCDVDEAHVRAINEIGITIEGPVENFSVKATAIVPSELPSNLEYVAIAVKSHHTKSAVDLIRGKLAPHGYVVSLQNGLTAGEISEVVGAENVIVSFVNFGADYLSPGRIMQGNIGAFHVGELLGDKITQRVQDLANAFPYAEPTNNILGYLWGKEAYGAMLYAGATSDLSIADHLEMPQYRPLMLAIAKEVLAQSPVKPESFNGFVPDDLEASLDRLVTFNRMSAKTHSGIYRDLTVRKRKTEVDDLLRDLKGPITNYIGAIIKAIERGERVCEESNLDLLATYERALRVAVPLNAISSIIPAPHRALSGALCGVAVAVKDIIDVKGQPRGNGNPNDMAGPLATSDAPVILQLRQLGADIFATTSLLEYAAGATNPHIPEAMNPFNPKLTAGGSSGGSASIVGAGVCDVALGTDTGGSIRIPAHYCGIVGFKPSYNAISLEGVTPLSPTFDHVGILAKDVTTTIKVFESLVPSAKSMGAKPLSDLKIGVFKAHYDIPELEIDVKNSIENVIKALKIQGVTFVEMDYSLHHELERTFEHILMYEAWEVHGAQIIKNPNHYGPDTFRFLSICDAVTKEVYESALAQRSSLLEKISEIYKNVDILLTPGCPYVSPETTPPMDTPKGAVEGIYTSVFNATGEPAIVIPSGLDSNGLPIGVQLVSIVGSDNFLLDTAKLIESLLALDLKPKIK